MKLKLSLVFLLFFGWLQSALSQTVAPKNWHLMDAEADQYRGISLQKAYDFLKGKKSKPVIVAVIDSGVDIEHPDLKKTSG